MSANIALKALITLKSPGVKWLGLCDMNKNAMKLGSLGGKASAKKLSKKQKKERAMNAVKAREAKRSQKRSLQKTPKK